MAYQQPYYQPPPQKRSSATWWIIGGCGVILVLTALCACGFFVLGGAALLSTETPAPAPAVAEPATVQPSAVPSEPTDTPQPPAPPTDTPKPIPTSTPALTNTPTLRPTNTPAFPTSTPIPIVTSPVEFDDEMIATMMQMASSSYGVTRVEIVDGRAAGGERVAIVTLETDTTDMDAVFSGLGAVFGAAYAVNTDAQADLDAVDVIVGNRQGIATMMVSVYMSDIKDWRAGRLTDEQFINTWITADF